MLNNSLLEQIRTDSSNSSKVFLILLQMLLKKGKPAKKISYQSCPYIKILKRTSSLKFIYQAVRNLLPLVELSSSSSFGSNIRSSSIKPVPLLPRRSSFLAINWLIQGATQRTERSFSLRSYREIVEAYDKKGFAFRKKIEWHTRCYAGYTKSNMINNNINKIDKTY